MEMNLRIDGEKSNSPGGKQFLHCNCEHIENSQNSKCINLAVLEKSQDEVGWGEFAALAFAST